MNIITSCVLAITVFSLVSVSDQMKSGDRVVIREKVHHDLYIAGGTVTIKVAIADDHSLVRQGLRRYLDMADGIEVVGEASNGKELLDLVTKEQPDIALIDIRMPEMDGLEAAREIRDNHGTVGVIMLTAYDDRQFVVEAVRAGARGYVLKARDAEHLIQTVRLVAGGNMVIDPQLVVADGQALQQVVRLAGPEDRPVQGALELRPAARFERLISPLADYREPSQPVTFEATEAAPNPPSGTGGCQPFALPLAEKGGAGPTVF
jgi:DNA-binding NarL/FixJ family response regulator